MVHVQLRKASNKMERMALIQSDNVIHSGAFSIDGVLLMNNNINIEIEVNSNSDILLNNIKDIKELNIIINPNSNVKLSFLTESEINDSKINIKVKNNSILTGYFADFSEKVLNLHCLIDLAEEGATCNFKVASLTAGNDRKLIDISLDHSTKKTYGKFDCFGICKDNGKITVSGTSHIYKGSVKSKTQQNCKIMVFDEASDATAKPILKIDENDLEASHAAVVGKINDEHLFYLTSRGLSEENAKELITLGYLKPILEGFAEDDIKDHISSLIERRM